MILKTEGDVVMEFIQLAKERYSVRKFSDRKIERETLDLILEAGRLAPTAVNFQPQRILVLDSMETLTKLVSCTPYHFHAPLALLVCYDSTVSWKRSYDNKDMGDIDAGIVATQMMLEAAELGLGSTWVGHFDPAAIRTAFDIPEHLIPVVLLPMGYPREDCVPSPYHEKRFNMEHTVFFNSFQDAEPPKG